MICVLVNIRKGEEAAAAFGGGTTTAIPLEANTVAIKALFTFGF